MKNSKISAGATKSSLKILLNRNWSDQKLIYYDIYRILTKGFLLSFISSTSNIQPRKGTYKVANSEQQQRHNIASM
jgi:hypothetical protein